ncbi:MAG: Fic family protein [Candidatus Sumerlaeota bacterium]|nr:Fic family protein [Candidatus Sumerlaeota bacterium]
MLTLQLERMARASIPIATSWLLGACMEARGKQDLWTQRKPEALAALREQALIQSVESSNRIEGVTVPAERLRPVVLGKSRPRDRSEEELFGYRRALDWIFSRKRPIRMEPAVLLRLHSMAQGGFSGDAGRWKSRDNEIIEILPNGERRVRFRPTPAKETPRTIDLLCSSYREACEEERIPPLLTVATFVFDFLCIHPFRDGNGRVSRLATILLLQDHGHHVGWYVSLERLIEESKEEYYAILEDCSRGWHEGRNEIVPWWNYFFGVLRRAYQEFARQVERVEARPAKSALIRQAILDQAGAFALSDLAAQCPSASLQLVKKVLAAMKQEGEIRLTGVGRGARWEHVPRRQSK